VDAHFGIIGGAIGIVELAQASGLALVPPKQRDPTRTTTLGTGQLISHAIASGCREIIVCIGGSATIDGGTGIAQALGWRFLDGHGGEIGPLMCGGTLGRIAKMIAPETTLPRMRVACDVVNPLCGLNGAAAVYGPQKGATLQQVKMLDDGLTHLAKLAGGDPNAPGAGAAGGAGYGLATFLNATLERGIDLVLEMVRFNDTCRGADLVITGEGRLDSQSLQGKACMGVAAAARRLGVPTIAIVGSTGPGAERCIGPGKLSAYHSLADRFGEDRARREAKTLMADLTEEAVRGLS
jgi:glycerate kinase